MESLGHDPLNMSQRAVEPRSGHDWRREGGPSFVGCLGLIAIVFVAATGTGLIFLSRSSPLETPSPVVLFVDRGRADLQPRLTADWNPGVTGAVLHAGDTVYTWPTSSASIKFPDGSKAQLAPDTALKVRAAWISAKGVISTATLDHLTGRVLYSIASTPGTDFEVATDAVSFEAGGSVFEVDQQPDGLVTLKVFEGLVSTRAGTTTPFSGSVAIQAGQQQFYDRSAGPIGPVEALQPDLRDPFVQLQRVEAAAAVINSTPGTEQNFSSVELLQTGQTTPAGDFSTGGGDITAMLTTSGSEIGLTIIDPTGEVHRAQGVSPVIVRIPGGPPGSYRAEVTGIRVTPGGDFYAVAFVVADACYPAEGNGYVRKFQGWAQVAQSVKIANVSDVSLTNVASPGEAVVDSRVEIRGVLGTMTALIYATPPNAQVLVLSLKFQGMPIPNRIVDTVNSKLTALSTDFKVDRVFACGDGLMIEGRSI